MFNAHLAIQRFLLFWRMVFIILLVLLNEHHSKLHSKYKESNIYISIYKVKLILEIYYRRIKIIFPKSVDWEIKNISDQSYFGPPKILEKYCSGQHDFPPASDCGRSLSLTLLRNLKTLRRTYQH